MAAVYVKEQGAYVKKIDKRLVIQKNGMELADIPLHTISNVSIFGNVQISTQVLHMLMEEGIDISFFTYSGNLLGQVSADSSKNIFLRFAQYERYQDIEARLRIAREIVRNKAENQIAVIRHYNWDDLEYDYTDDVEAIRKLISKLDAMNTSNSVMGIEGSCSAIYFGAYSHMFKCSISFDKRNRRPPKDPINIILSLAYTLLTKEVTAALDSESFETYIGFLHGIRYGRKSLGLDIVEEFRQPVVDRLVLQLFNKRILSEFDFERQDERIVLTEDGFKKFCKEYELWMKKPICRKNERSFRSVIRGQAALLKHAIREKGDYIPFNWEKELNEEGENVSGDI